jgi:hypothetical protein
MGYSRALTAVGINAIIGFAVVVLLHGLLLTNSNPSVARWTPFASRAVTGTIDGHLHPTRSPPPGDWGFVDSFIGLGLGRRCWPSRITTGGAACDVNTHASAGRSSHDAVVRRNHKYTERAVVCTYANELASNGRPGRRPSRLRTHVFNGHHGDQEMTSMRVFIRAATGLFVFVGGCGSSGGT